jgi:hypothetical protein
MASPCKERNNIKYIIKERSSSPQSEPLYSYIPIHIATGKGDLIVN